MWLALSGAAEYIDVSTDTISRRAVEWPKDNLLVPGKVRYKHLKFGDATRQERRYYVPDLVAMLN